MSYSKIKVHQEDNVCTIIFDSPESNNTINDKLIDEFHAALDLCDHSVTVVVIEGLPEVFCFGADFDEIHTSVKNGQKPDYNPEALYDLWMKLSTGPYITIAHVRGKANAGGVGFTAACDIVVADHTAQFSLSELLFGLFPACVLPFLIRRVGFQKAHYLTVMTQPVSAQQAQSWGLVDVLDEDSKSAVRKHLLRLKRLSKPAIRHYKQYMAGLYDSLQSSKSFALKANREIFSNSENLMAIYNYVERGEFPWENKNLATSAINHLKQKE